MHLGVLHLLNVLYSSIGSLGLGVKHERKIILVGITIVVVGIVIFYLGYWLYRLGVSVAGVITVLEIGYAIPHRWLIALWRHGKHEMEIIKIRRQQTKDPDRFIVLKIEMVDFNPKASLKKEQDYLIISLSVTSALLKDFPLDRLLGNVSVDGTNPADKFEITNDLVIKKTGKKTSWENITVPILKNTQEHLHVMREQEQDVVVSVTLSGYRNGKLVLSLTGETGKTRVPKLPI